MSNTFRILGGILGVFLVLVVGVYISNTATETKVYSSVAQGNQYQSTTTSSTWDTPALVIGGIKLLSCGVGTLGSVVVQNETVGSFTLYDGTTTSSHNLHPTTTLAKVYASQAEGTYTYDSQFTYGLIVEFQSPNVASSTITFRGNPVCNN